MGFTALTFGFWISAHPVIAHHPSFSFSDLFFGGRFATATVRPVLGTRAAPESRPGPAPSPSRSLRGVDGPLRKPIAAECVTHAAIVIFALASRRDRSWKNLACRFPAADRRRHGTGSVRCLSLLVILFGTGSRSCPTRHRFSADRLRPLRHPPRCRQSLGEQIGSRRARRFLVFRFP